MQTLIRLRSDLGPNCLLRPILFDLVEVLRPSQLGRVLSSLSVYTKHENILAGTQLKHIT